MAVKVIVEHGGHRTEHSTAGAIILLVNGTGQVQIHRYNAELSIVAEILGGKVGKQVVEQWLRQNPLQ